ncbi:bifunctional nitric oxide dioxygenase/dihydropteridine reductase 2 [Alcanivorax hongdengensis A-11-3]|uniref:Flavohemoprotein n=1 Tax=Alcanivorax hongdengensis A-11-3 TaxID=1177179 RepID=L0W7Z5_9GAMM|nr:NO-inducible flavohemoprotein [Alcanivorax hongdengensis]EKF73026.1 bifunctional nitric oxide dioxygenase/dihydropteridine reductase 2 [Alcanivorax hongdengensis A-11-3]
MLSAAQLDVIKQTVPVLQENGEVLTRHFYQRMFLENPEVLAFFNPAHQHAGTQQRALAGAICAYAQNIENPAALASAVELIAQKHASLGIRAEHYPIVGQNLLASIQEVLGEAATPAIIDAWAAAYGVLADIFINREQQIYDDQQASFGWSGFKRFVVEKREMASDNIVSFYLAPEDGQPLPAHQPGQYITLRLTPPGSDPVMRNYSLSNRPGASRYRISVKREPALEAGAPAGLCSGFLHDQVKEGDVVELAPPCGEFTLGAKPNAEKPLVLIAGGVGITPILSMLYAALEQQSGRQVVFIQCALNGAVRPFADELATLKEDYANLKSHVRLSEPQDADRRKGGYDSEGLLDNALLDQLIGKQQAEFYLCGPTPMLRHVWQLLKARGVDEADIHFEFFGPAGDLAA